MEKINKDTLIMEAIELNPNAGEILLSYGMHCLGCAIAHGETIGEAAIANILLSTEYPKYYRRKFLKCHCPAELVAEIAKELNVQIP